MKKSNLHSLIIGILLVASFCCYIFLNTVTVVPENDISSSNTELEEQREEASTEIMMPDIELVKKILSKSKVLLPTY